MESGARREEPVMSVRRYFAKMTNLDVWYAHQDIDQLRAQFDSQMKARQRKMVDKGVARARTRDSMQEVAKLTRLVDGLLRSSPTCR